MTLAQAVGSQIECTGVSAVWCSVHGDCSCPYRFDNPQEGRTFDSDECPLHARTSKHADGEPITPLARAVAHG